jgi:hypothetical protein
MRSMVAHDGPATAPLGCRSAGGSAPPIGLKRPAMSCSAQSGHSWVREPMEDGLQYHKVVSYSPSSGKYWPGNPTGFSLTPKPMGFFRQLGFQFDPRFTDDQAACMPGFIGAHIVRCSRCAIPFEAGWASRAANNSLTLYQANMSATRSAHRLDRLGMDGSRYVAQRREDWYGAGAGMDQTARRHSISHRL